MNIKTPIPVQFANHKGMKTNPIVMQHDIKLYKASTLKSQLPEALCISFNGNNWITFRFSFREHANHWSRNSYFEIAYILDAGTIYYSGKSRDLNMHRDIMHTFEIVQPIAELVFKSRFPKAA